MQDKRLGLAAHIGCAVGAALLGNGVIALFGWNAESNGNISPGFAPPGFVIGIVWTVLFAGMGAARWLTLRDGGASGRGDSALILLLLAACFAYPYYTAGFRSAAAGLAGSLFTMILAAIIAGRVSRRSKLAAVLIGAVAAWCAFASLILWRTLQLSP